MPELPEVEAIRRVIEPQIQGLTIEQITVSRREVVAHPTADEFCRCLTGQIFDSMTRRGKFLVIRLKSGDKIIIHLRMTGCLLVTPTAHPEEKHTHIIFRLNNGKELRFSDTRRFGRFWLLKKGKADTYSGIEKLGKEPLDPDFTAEYLYTRLGNRKKTIKECLMEQSVIAGIGNIYSDEILFTARIYPGTTRQYADKRGMEPSCFGYSGAADLLYRKEQDYAGGISGDKGTGLPQHALFTSLRP